MFLISRIFLLVLTEKRGAVLTILCLQTFVVIFRTVFAVR